MDRQRIARLVAARESLRNGSRAGLGELAREACVSPFHFIREYEQLFGVTPHQARIEARLERAKQMLRQGDHNVTEVCLEMGMSSMGSFSDWFRKRTGMAPREYQRQARVMVAGGWVAQPGCFSLMTMLPPGAFRNFREADSSSRH